MVEGRKEAARSARIRLGMVGGGRDAFIGGVHRIAARLDDHYELVAGAFSSTPEKSRASALDLGVAAERAYANYNDMAEQEALRDDGIEAVSIVTPNHLHYPVACAFLERGIHVICDKPMTSSLEDAKALVSKAAESNALFVLTHNYTAYPMIRQARAMVAEGLLGDIRVVQVEYAQDWLATNLEDTGQKQAGWRTDPERSGMGGCIGDIGTHAFNLAAFVSGLELDSLCADIQSFVPGRQLDDNANVMLRFRGGARGMLWSSQVATGNENALRLRIYGDKSGIDWCQEDPNYLWFTELGKPRQLITRGGSGAHEAAAAVTRIPGGHPEGYLEGFANLYTEAASAIYAARAGAPAPENCLYPTVLDGLAGVAFVAAVVSSSKAGGVWKALDDGSNQH